MEDNYTGSHKNVTRKRKRVLFLNWLEDFSQHSSLQGFQYLTNKQLTILEKLFWIVTIVISIALCYVYISDALYKWRRDPIIVSFNSELEPVRNIFFPSITICPHTKVLSDQYNYTDELLYYKNYLEKMVASNQYLDPVDQRRLEQLENIQLVCGKESENYMISEDKVVSSRKKGNESILKDIFEASIKKLGLFVICSWHNQNCENEFKTVLTSEGVCYNFNAMPFRSMLRGKALQNNLVEQEQGHDSPTKRGRESASTPDLMVLLMEQKGLRDESCNALYQGYKVYLQHPSDFPRTSLFHYSVLLNDSTALALTFNMITSAKSIEKHSTKIRQCYFPHERILRYFQNYTKSNCELECESDFIFSSCGCVWFDLPFYDSEHYCTANSSECVKTAKEKLAIRETEQHEDACMCLSTCKSVKYEADIVKSKYDLPGFMKKIKFLDSDMENFLDEYHYTKLAFYFKESSFVSMHRSEVFGLADLLGNCGGLLGLFLGFSFLSLIEIVYFITLRERICNEHIRQKTKVIDIVRKFSTLKWQWAHVTFAIEPLERCLRSAVDGYKLLL